MVSDDKLSTKQKADIISEKILRARKWGIDLFLPKESISDDCYELWLNHETPDVVIVSCSYKGAFQIQVPGFEAYAEDFDSIISVLDTLLNEISY